MRLFPSTVVQGEVLFGALSCGLDAPGVTLIGTGLTDTDRCHWIMDSIYLQLLLNDWITNSSIENKINLIIYFYQEHNFSCVCTKFIECSSKTDSIANNTNRNTNCNDALSLRMWQKVVKITIRIHANGWFLCIWASQIVEEISDTNSMVKRFFLANSSSSNIW